MSDATCKKSLQVPTIKDYLTIQDKFLRDKVKTFSSQEAYELHLDVGELLDEIDLLRAGIAKARDALDNYDYHTSMFDIVSELDDLLGDEA